MPRSAFTCLTNGTSASEPANAIPRNCGALRFRGEHGFFRPALAVAKDHAAPPDDARADGVAACRFARIERDPEQVAAEVDRGRRIGFPETRFASPQPHLAVVADGVGAHRLRPRDGPQVRLLSTSRRAEEAFPGPIPGRACSARLHPKRPTARASLPRAATGFPGAAAIACRLRRNGTGQGRSRLTDGDAVRCTGRPPRRASRRSGLRRPLPWRRRDLAVACAPPPSDRTS